MEFFSDSERDAMLRQARRDLLGDMTPSLSHDLFNRVESATPEQKEAGQYNIPKYVTPPKEYYQLTEEKYNIPPGTLHAIAGVESNYNPAARSPTGVRGLMQITGKTGHAYGLGEQEFWDPYRQIDTAARIMQDNLKTTSGDLHRALALYGDHNEKDYADKVLARLEKPPEQPRKEKPGFSFVENQRRQLLPARDIDIARDVYKASGLPDLPAYARAAGTGLVAGATAGLIDDPRAVTTSTQAMVHGLFSMLGSAAPFSASVRAANAVGVSKTLAGAATGLVYEEIQHRGQASAGQLALSVGLGALYGKFWKAPEVPAKAPSIVFKESLAKLARESDDPMIRKTYMGYVRAGEGYPGYTYQTPKTYKTPSGEVRFRGPGGKFVDPDLHEMIATFDRFWKQVPDGEVAPSDLVNGLHKLRKESDLADVAKIRGHMNEPDGPQSDMFEIPPGSHAQVKMYGRITEPRRGPQPRVLSTLSQIIPTKSQMLDIDERLGSHVYNDVFEKVEDARRVADGHVDTAFNELGQALRGSNRSKARGMLEYALKPSAETARRFGLSDADVQAVNRGYKVWRKHWEDAFAIPPDRYLREIVPKIRAARSVEGAFPNDPGGDVGKMLEFARYHEANLKENDFAKFLASHIRAAVYEQHFEPAYKTAMRVAGDRELPGEVRDYLYHYLRDVRGGQSRFLDVMQGHVGKMWRMLGANATEPQVRTYLHMLTDLTHTGLAGFNPSSLLKVIFHLPQTGGRMSFRWLWHGVTEAMTPKGWQIARDAGMMGEFKPAVVDFEPAFRPPAGVRFTRWMANMGLKPHTTVYNFNRAATYLGQRARTLEAASIKGLSEEEFMTRAGIWTLHPVLRRDISAAWELGFPEEAADLAGKHMAQDTQWMYRQGYRAPALRSELARYYGMFGVWPSSFIDYLRQMWSMDMPMVERTKWAGRWLAGNMAILGTLGVGAASVGMSIKDVAAHTMPWTFVGPLFDYRGGPIVDTFMALPKSYHAMWNGEFATAAKPFTDVLKTPIPGLNVARAVAGARGELGDILEEEIGPETEKSLGIAPSRTTLPSENRAEEAYRILTGIRRTQ